MAVSVSPNYEEPNATERLAAEAPRQVANAATIWATANVVIFLPLVALFSRAVTMIVPDRPEPDTQIVRPRYLDEKLIVVPALGLERGQMELGHMAEWADRMLRGFKPALESRDPEALNDIIKDGDKVIILRDAIVAYARRLGRGELTDSEAAALATYPGTATDIESIADVISRELIPVGQAFLKQDIEASETTGEMLVQA